MHKQVIFNNPFLDIKARECNWETYSDKDDQIQQYLTTVILIAISFIVKLIILILPLKIIFMAMPDSFLSFSFALAFQHKEKTQKKHKFIFTMLSSTVRGYLSKKFCLLHNSRYSHLIVILLKHFQTFKWSYKILILYSSIFY